MVLHLHLSELRFGFQLHEGHLILLVLVGKSSSLHLSSNNICLVQVVAVAGSGVVAVAGSGVMKRHHFLQMPWSSYVTIFQSCCIIVAEASSSSFVLSSVLSVLLSVDCQNN